MGNNYATTLAKVLKVRNDIDVVQKNILAKQKEYIKFSEDSKDDIEALSNGPLKENLKKTDIELKASFTQLLT
ncbi:hypothetical protein OFN30_31770, partial [Escherichia coli]|nr:hypothetical protein [Escherichia coli]